MSTALPGFVAPPGWSAAPVRPRPVLLQPETWLCFATVWGFVVNEWIGPNFLALSLLLWTIYCLKDPGFLARTLDSLSILVWLVPLVSLLSVAWSHMPLHSARSAIQGAVTVALALLTARAVSPRRFIACLWVAMGFILVASLINNNQYYDGMTGRVSMAGVFTNKNTLSSCAAMFAMSSAALLFSRDMPAFFRLIAFFGVGFGMSVSVLARSVAAIGSMMLGLTVMGAVVAAFLLPRIMRRGYVTLVLVGSLAAGAVLLLLLLNFSDEMLALVGKESTLTGRTTLWFYADRVTQERPAFGVGFQAFWHEGYPPAELVWRAMRIKGRYGFNFHSLYYEILSQLGYIGVTAAIVTIVYALLVTATWARRNPEAGSAFCLAMAVVITSEQWQAASLFAPFSYMSYFLMVAVAYAAGGLRHDAWLRRAMAARRPPQPVRGGGRHAP